MWVNKNTIPFTKINKAKPLTINEVQYPIDIFYRWTETQLNAIGLYSITISEYPNGRYYEANEIETFDTETPTITYEAIEKPLLEVQASLVKSIENTATNKFNTATGNYTAGEMSSWTDMEVDAIAHNNPDPLANGMLFDEATISGITIDDLVNKVLANAAALKQVKSYIAGTRSKKTKEVTELISIDACILYEKTPYSYTLTEEDIIDGIGTVGDIVVRYEDKCIEW